MVSLTLSSDDGSLFIVLLLIVAPLFVIVPIIATFLRRLRIRRKILATTIIAEYETPDTITPAELGYMYDGKVRANELKATIYHLELRGKLEINRSSRQVSVLPNKIDMTAYEQLVVRSVVSGKNIDDIVADSGLMAVFQNAVYEHLCAKGYFYRNAKKGWALLILKMYGVSLLAIGIALPLYSLSQTNLGQLGFEHIIFIIQVTITMTFYAAILSIFILPFFYVIAVALAHLYLRISGQHWLGTQQLKKIWPQIEGFRIYVQQAEANKLQFASDDIRHRIVEKNYPYAIALGIVR